MNWVIHPSGGDRSVKEREALGEFLRREREMKKVSLREMAKHTKVREHFLKAIEEERYDLLPSPIYARGFLSAYAKHVGLDPHDVLLRYERLLKGEPIIHSEVKSERKASGKTFIKTIWNRRQIWMVSGIIAITLLVSYFLHPFLSRPPVEPLPVKPETHEAIPVTLTLQTSEVFPAVEGKPFSLEIKAVEETWVRIRVDDQPQAEAIFKPGEGNSYQAARQIELLIGNAGGLDMIFNGRKLERFGQSGEVVTLVFTPQGAERK
jgi:cytoskeletal protein RodZ